MQSIFNKRIAIMLSIMMTALFIPTASYASSEADTITYSVDAGDDVDFEGDDFNNACEDLMDAGLDYVKFELPDSDDGTLYYDYDGDDQEEVDDSDEYYYSGDEEISDVTFVADDDCSDTVTIDYTGYDEDGNDYDGEIEITVDGDDDEADDIDYSVDAGDSVDFDEDDFNDACNDLNDADLNYVNFTLPSSSKGILYYDYDGDDEEKVSASTEYYYDDDPSISDVSFLADDDYDGTVTISYEGCDADDNEFSGKITIDVSGDDDDDDDDDSADTIYFSGTAGSNIALVASYFNNKCDDLTGNSLNYVKFTLPSSSTGTLYYNYTSETNNTAVTSSTKYYYSDDTPYLKKVSFVPAGTSAQTVTVKYTGYDTSGTSYTGSIIFTITASASTSTSTNTVINSNPSPSTTSTTAAEKATATPTSAKVVVDGKTVSFDAYNINGSNYFKLRDIAYAINGTTKQFGVSYDSSKNAISLTSNSVYTTAGGELASGDGKAKTAALTTSPIYKDGTVVSLGAYNINGNNYFKLRDLAKAFNIGVSWNSTSNTVEISTVTSYTE